MRIGVFGGCFNPPHNKHLSIALELIQNNYLDKVIYVPTGSCYEKKDIIPFNHRYNMLKILTKRYPNLEISNISSNPKFFYTYQVLDEMQKRYLNNELFFICGEDNLETLDTWKNYQYILRKYQILVIKRGNKNLEKIIKKYAPYQKHIIACNIRSEGTSSTLIREKIKTGNFKNLNKFIDKEIYQYIIENNLYKEIYKMETIIEKLKEKGKTISTMESCTGGGLANAITNIEGASDVFKFGAITYSNEFKIKMGVDSEIIDNYSVYSFNTSEEMSKKIAQFTGSDYGIGITGKLNRADKQNPAQKDEEDNNVYISIYDTDRDCMFNYGLKVSPKSRKEVKDDIIDFIVERFKEIIK